jgi:hypothetical protein
MFPADDQLPCPEAGLNNRVVFRVVDPLLPPVSSTLPFASAVAVCPSRELERAVRLLQFEVPSNNCTLVTEALPELPPTTRTLLFSVPFDEMESSVALWNLTAWGMFCVVLQAPFPELGS